MSLACANGGSCAKDDVEQAASPSSSCTGDRLGDMMQIIVTPLRAAAPRHGVPRLLEKLLDDWAHIKNS